jgi:hypothetical protein
MMSIDTVHLLLFITCCIGASVSWWYGREKYDQGFMDAIQLHSEGRLTYNTELQDDGVQLITIEVRDEM